MKILLQKLGCFFLILILIKLSFVLFYKDRFTYENVAKGVNKYEVAHRKTEFTKQDFDTVFVGSSRTAYGVSPAYFDSLTRRKTNSYNFGIISGKPPHTFDWCAELMQTKPSLKYIFVELSGGFVEPTTEDNWLLTFFKPSVPRKEYENILFSYKLPLQNIPLEEFLNKKDKPISQRFSQERFQLSRSLNLQIEQETSIAAPAFNEAYWSAVADLIELAESKQMRIYFFIAPRLKTDNELKMIHPIYQKLESKYKLRAPHYEEALYQSDTSFDHYHLNYKGAKRFTELLAEAFDAQSP